MSDSDAPSKLKVTDRRLFDRDGNPRTPDEQPAGETTAADERTAAAVPPPVEVVDEPVVAPAPPAPPRPVEPTVAPVDPPPAAPATTAPEALRFSDETLLKFLEEQYIGGLLALGAMPEPQTGQVVEDLEMAQLRIELLALLQERTEGTRGPEPTQALEDVLYQLRMVYLQKRKVAKL